MQKLETWLIKYCLIYHFENIVVSPQAFLVPAGYVQNLLYFLFPLAFGNTTYIYFLAVLMVYESQLMTLG